jgi:capsular polysaccharide biosynthesis protein
LQNSQLNGRGYVTPMDSEMRPGDDTFPGTRADELFLSQADLARIMRRRLWVIALVGFIFAGLAAGFSFVQTPTYEASIKVLIGQKQSSDIPPDLGNEVAGLQQITATMVEAVQTRPVAQGAIERLDLRMSPTSLLENLSAEQIGTTSFLEVSYADSNPERAQRIANTVGEVFSDQISKTSPSANAITATVWEPAVLPDEPAAPSPIRNVVLALVLGLMLGLGLAFLLEYLDNSWDSPEELERVSGVPTYGVIPAFKVHKSQKAQWG